MFLFFFLFQYLELECCWLKFQSNWHYKQNTCILFNIKKKTFCEQSFCFLNPTCFVNKVEKILSSSDEDHMISSCKYDQLLMLEGEKKKIKQDEYEVLQKLEKKIPNH